MAFCWSMSCSRPSTSIALSQSQEHSSATIRSPALGNVGPARSGRRAAEAREDKLPVVIQHHVEVGPG